MPEQAAKTNEVTASMAVPEMRING
jgi:hypothetical protein